MQQELVADVQRKDGQIATMEREIANKIVIMEGELAKREERMAAKEGELSSRIKQLEVILNTCYRWPYEHTQYTGGTTK